jgi:pectinesterase
MKPNKPDGRNRVDGNGYTNLENYLNDLVPERTLTKAADAAPGLIFVAATGARYATLQSAVDALPAEGGEITLSAGVYREKVIIDKPHVRLQGVGARPQDVVIAWDATRADETSTLKSATLYIRGDDFRAENLTIRNDYPLRSARPSQAIALSVSGDRALFTRVRLLGADFVGGDSRAFFDHCEIDR